jgi:hypothetical protein
MARKYQLHGAFPSKAGDSAYEVALRNGFEGTEQEWLDSLVGPPGQHGIGESAYEVALRNGFEGTEQEWLDSLVGPQGPQGPQGLEGGTGATFYFTVTLEEDVSSVNLLLPVNWGRIIQFNIHADTKGNNLTADMGFEAEIGGSYANLGTLRTSFKASDYYGIRYMWDDNNTRFAIGKSTADNSSDLAVPTLGTWRPSTGNNKNNFRFISKTEGAMFPKGMKFSVWGVYA